MKNFFECTAMALFDFPFSQSFEVWELDKSFKLKWFYDFYYGISVETKIQKEKYCCKETSSWLEYRFMIWMCIFH